MTEFAFRGGTKDKRCMINDTTYWTKNNRKKNGNHYSLTSIKQAVKFLENCFFKVDSQIFYQNIGIPMNSEPPTFFANLFHSITNLNGLIK